MTQELEFSIMAGEASGIRPLLERFEAETRIRVRLRLLSWDTAWSTIVRAALYSDGPDVSEIGTTWIGDLAGMNALRPFNAAEVASLGKASAFEPALWKTATQQGDTHVWAVPWMSGARLVFYRSDLLEKAGVDPVSVFTSSECLEDAVQRLAEAGVKYPWTAPTGVTHTTLLNTASWVWAAGGDFLTPDGRQTAFMEQASIDGLRAYYRLGRYLAPEVLHLNGLEPDTWFLNHPETGMTISGQWLFCEARQRNGGLQSSLRAALPPGASFVGGSNLVIWKYCRNPEAAVRLIRFLTSTPALVEYCPKVGLLPARTETLGVSPFAADPLWQKSVEGLRTGRIFPTVRLWGLVEDRLTAGLSAIWADVLANPFEDPEKAVRKNLAPIAKRLDALLKEG